MDVNRLLSDELTYELAIRGLPAEGATVEQKRHTLRSAFQAERCGTVSVPRRCDFSAVTELVTCTQKLDELSGSIQEFDVANRENDYRRISTRLAHVVARLDRIQPCNSETETEILRVLAMAEHMQVVLQEARNRARTSEHAQSSLLDEPVEGLVEVADPPLVASNAIPEILRSVNTTSRSRVREEQRPLAEIVEADIGLEGPFRRSSEIPQNPRQPLPSRGLIDQDILQDLASLSMIPFRPAPRRPEPPLLAPSPPINQDFNPVYKWNITFDGKSSVLSFLERVEELRISRGLSEIRLYQAAVELFVGDALLWFRSNRDQLHSWSDIVARLKKDFMPYDYELSLWETIRKRTQGEEERIVLYVAVMESLFARLLTKPDEKTRVEWIKRNLLPSLQTQLALHPINSLAQLLELGRTVEEAQQRVKSFCPPPSKSFVEPELGCRPKSKQLSVVDVDETVATSPKPPGTPFRCWKCDALGHRASECRRKPGVMCFKCKTPNVTIRSCPKCNQSSPQSSGNASPRR